MTVRTKHGFRNRGRICSLVISGLIGGTALTSSISHAQTETGYDNEFKNRIVCNKIDEAYSWSGPNGMGQLMKDMEISDERLLLEYSCDLARYKSVPYLSTLVFYPKSASGYTIFKSLARHYRKSGKTDVLFGALNVISITDRMAFLDYAHEKYHRTGESPENRSFLSKLIRFACRKGAIANKYRRELVCRN